MIREPILAETAQIDGAFTVEQSVEMAMLARRRTTGTARRLRQGLVQLSRPAFPKMGGRLAR